MKQILYPFQQSTVVFYSIRFHYYVPHNTVIVGDYITRRDYERVGVLMNNSLSH